MIENKDLSHMSSGQKLLKDILLYGVANFGSSIVVFFMLPIYTRYFTTTEYGLWDLIVTTTTLLIPFITFELVAAVYRWLIEEKADAKRKEIITTGVWALIRNIIIFDIIALVVLLFVNIPFGLLSIIFINTSILSSFFQQCARGLGFNKLFASLGIIQTVITASLNLFFIFGLSLRIEAFFYAMIIAGIFVIIFAWKMMGFSQYINKGLYTKQMMQSFLTYSIPIIPGAASWWVMTMSDRYFITLYLGMEFNGIYAVANKIPALLLMINSVFFLAWKDSAILKFHSVDKNDYYSVVFKSFFRLMATTVICLSLMTKPLLTLFIAGDFFDAWQYIGILLLGTLFHAFALFWSAGYHGAKKTKVIFFTSLIGAIINVLVNLVFITYIGLYAVVLSTLVAFLAVWLIRIFSAGDYFKIIIGWGDFLILFPAMIVAIIAPFMLGNVGLIIAICLGGCLFVGYNWSIIRLLLKHIYLILKK